MHSRAVEPDNGSQTRGTYQGF
ncbi:MAG: hypothetical protein K0R44_1613, partial [Thermomicrobiales bacterium]|nr:hypothetical protein [Thermomicrobiales bacterium]